MPEFIIDLGTETGEAIYNAMDAFTKGYTEAIFWLLDDELPKDLTVSDLSQDAIDEIVADCRVFQEAHKADLEGAYRTGYDEHRAGVDFWLTRNHHGAGFWDRGLGDVGARLTTSAHTYGSRDAYQGDDKLLYLM